MTKIRLPSRLENLEKLMRFVSDFARDRGFSREKIGKIELATEEALVNIIHHAYSDKTAGDIEISCTAENSGALVVEILDKGPPFDIDSVSAPDISATLSERQPGGLGIFLIRKMVDEMHYRRDGKSNILTFVFNKET